MSNVAFALVLIGTVGLLALASAVGGFLIAMRIYHLRIREVRLVMEHDDAPTIKLVHK